MPLSTFDGEPSEALHEHYDRRGRLTGTTVVITPGWSDTDRAWALALADREAARCPRGHDLTESLPDGNEWVWVADDPFVCRHCVAIDVDVEKHKNDPQRAAMLHSVRKVPKPKPRKRGG